MSINPFRRKKFSYKELANAGIINHDAPRVLIFKKKDRTNHPYMPFAANQKLPMNKQGHDHPE